MGSPMAKIEKCFQDLSSHIFRCPTVITVPFLGLLSYYLGVVRI